MSELHLRQDWEHFAGESEKVIVAIATDDPSVDLSTAVSRLAINLDEEQSTPQVQASGTVEQVAKGWRAVIALAKGATSALPPAVYNYQVEIETAGDLRIICAGKVAIRARLGSSA